MNTSPEGDAPAFSEEQAAQHEEQQGELLAYDTSATDYAGIASVGFESVSAARDFAEMIVDTIQEGLLILDFDLRVKAANESFYRMFNVRPEETHGRLVYDLGNRQWDIPELHKLLDDILPDNDVMHDFDIEHTFEDIGRRIMLLNARRLNHHQMILLTIDDVTEQRESETALRVSEERFEHALSIETVGVVFWDADMRIMYANGAFLRMSGRGPEEAIGLTWQELTPEEFHPASERAIAEIEATGRTAPYEKQYYRKDGSRWWGLFAPRKLRDGEVVEFMLDVTERKEAEESLRASEIHFRQMAEAVPDVVFTTTPDGLVDYVSPRREEITGQPPETALGTRMWPHIIHPDDRSGAMKAWDRALAEQQPYEARYRVLLREGGYGWFIARARPIFDTAEDVVRWFGTLTDVNALSTAEEALRALNLALEERVEERTRQVRQLSSTLTMVEQEERHRIAQILHDDLQQQLFGLRMKLEMARLTADPEDKVWQHLAAAEDIAARCVGLTRSLTVDLSPPILKSEGLRDALDWLKVQMQDLHGLHVEVEAAHAFHTPQEDMRVLLFQSVRELLFNIVKHAGVDRAIVGIRGAQNHVEITVEDQGKGFDVAAEEARPRDKGFGLFSVRERLNLFGGGMQIESAPGAGTRVVLDVPLQLG